MRKLLAISVILFSGMLWAQCDPTTGAQCDGPATMPTGINADGTGTVMDTTFPNTSGYASCSATDTTSLNTCLSNSATSCSTTGYIINLTAGTTYTASTTFTVPSNNCSAGKWVIIRTSSITSSGQGTRTTATSTGKAILTTSNYQYPVVTIPDNPASPPTRIWFAGVEITANFTANEQTTLFMGGDYTGITGASTCSNLASNIVLDRSWIHGAGVSTSLRHGIRFTASNFALIDSIVDEVHSGAGADSTAISSDFSCGPVKIVNNEIAAVSENIIFGGGDPTIPDTITSDIEIRGNYIHKKSSWVATYGSQMKNLTECKNCQRMLVEGNEFDTNYDNGAYSAFHMTPRNPGGGCTWCTVNDVTLRYNHFNHIYSRWVTILGTQLASAGGDHGGHYPAKRLSYHDNLVENLDDSVSSSGMEIVINVGYATGTNSPYNGTNACPTTGTACQVSDISINHNTITSQGTTHVGSALLLDGTITGANDKGYNITVTNNIQDFGANGFVCSASGCASVHPITTAIASVFSSYTWNGNVYTNISGAGYSCSDMTGLNQCPTTYAAMTNVGFVNYNSGSGGDYRLCYGNGVPSGCTGASGPYSGATDSLNPGANIYAMKQKTAASLTGSPTIPAYNLNGQYTGGSGEHYYNLQFPGFFATNLEDGTGASPGNESRAGFAQFWDLHRDPTMKMNMNPYNSGLASRDLVEGSSQACGYGTQINDVKGKYGTISIIEQNNVRVVLLYRWPMVLASTNLPPASPIYSNQKFVIYRPGKFYERNGWDNSCGSTVSIGTFQYAMSSSWYNFSGVGTQYPPNWGTGWSESWWQANPCVSNTASYNPCTPTPWGWFGSAGLQFHSITSTFNQDSYTTTDGSTYYYGHSSETIPVTAEFAQILNEDSAATTYAYRGQAAVGFRSKISVAVSIPSNGTDSLVKHLLGLYGDLGIRSLANAQAYQTEYLTPPVPTMSVGSGAAFTLDEGAYTMTAGAGPSVTFTTTGTMHSPAFLISGWNNTVPSTITVGGVTKTKDVDYVAVATDATHLLLQIVNAPTYDQAGNSVVADATVPTSTQIVINAGAAPTNSTTINGGWTISGGWVVH